MALALSVGKPGKGSVDGVGLEIHLPTPAWKSLKQHTWPGNLRELSMVVHNLVSFTLVAAVDAIANDTANNVLFFDLKHVPSGTQRAPTAIAPATQLEAVT